MRRVGFGYYREDGQSENITPKAMRWVPTMGDTVGMEQNEKGGEL